MWMAGPARPTPPGSQCWTHPSPSPTPLEGQCSLWGGVLKSGGVRLTLGFGQCFREEEGVTIEETALSRHSALSSLHTVQPDVQHLKRKEILTFLFSSNDFPSRIAKPVTAT